MYICNLFFFLLHRDFDMLSPTSIKENNRLAFELSRSLGVACPLTPNMMVTTTIPDKLAVTSFVYQLYQYFTRATPSAVAKIDGSSGSAPVSPSGKGACSVSRFVSFIGGGEDGSAKARGYSSRKFLFSEIHSQSQVFLKFSTNSIQKYTKNVYHSQLSS